MMTTMMMILKRKRRRTCKESHRDPLAFKQMDFIPNLSRVVGESDSSLPIKMRDAEIECARKHPRF